MDGLRRKSPRKKLVSDESSLRKIGGSVWRAESTPKDIPFAGPRMTAAPPKENRSIRKRTSSLRLFLKATGVLALVALCFFGYFSWKIGGATRTMNITPVKSTPVTDTIHGATSLLAPLFGTNRTPLPGERDGRMNILLLGKANEKTAGQKLTDTIMVASLDFTRKKIALLSLPRDLYVKIPETSVSTKLNTLYEIDREQTTPADTVKRAVSTITGLPIHAFVTIDYDGFIRIIDLLGGVSLYVERDLFDSRFPGPNYSYETFEIKKGWQDLDGKTALKYARERHGDPEGDFGRAKRQQALLTALKQKTFSLQILLDPQTLSGIIETLGEHIRTDLSLKELRSLATLGYEFDTENIETVVVDAWKKDSLLRVSHVPVGNVSMFILVPRTGDWSEIRDLAENIFDLDRFKARREAIDNEEATIVIVNRSDASNLGQRIARLLTEDLNLRKTRVDFFPSSIETDENENGENGNLEQSILILRDDALVPETADEITKKLSLRTDESNQSFSREIFPNTDIILVLGNDIAKQFSFEEDTIEDLRNAENDLDYQQRLDAALLGENNQLTTDN